MDARERLIETILGACDDLWAGSAPTILDAVLNVRDDQGVPEIVNLLMEQVGFYHPEYGFEGMKHGLAGEENNGWPVYALRPEHRGEQTT